LQDSPVRGFSFWLKIVGILDRLPAVSGASGVAAQRICRAGLKLKIAVPDFIFALHRLTSANMLSDELLLYETK